MKNEKQNKDKGEFMEDKKTQTVCPYAKKCGGCQYQGVPYSAQLKKKQNQVQGLLKKFGNVKPVWKIRFIIETKFMLYLTVTGREILFLEFMRLVPTEWFLLNSV